MKMLLYIIVDRSGSMLEGGKNLIARGITRTIEQYCRLGYGHADIKLVSWSKEAKIVDWNPNDEYPAEMLVCESNADAEALTTLLSEQLNSKFLIITDGFFPRKDMRKLRSWIQSIEEGNLRIVKIGADANPQFKGPNIFTAEDCFAALSKWIDGGSS